MTQPSATSGIEIPYGTENVEAVLTAAQWAAQMEFAREQLAAEIAMNQARIAASLQEASMSAGASTQNAQLAAETQRYIADLQAQIDRDRLNLQKIDADRQYGLDVQRFGLDVAAQNWLEKTTALQFQMDTQRFGLEVAQFNAQQRQAETQAKLQTLELLASRSGPQDWVAYNNLVNGMSSPEAMARGEVDPFAFIAGQNQQYTPPPFDTSLLAGAGQNTAGGFQFPAGGSSPGSIPGVGTPGGSATPPAGTSPGGVISSVFGNSWQDRFNDANPGTGGAVATPPSLVEGSGAGFGPTMEGVTFGTSGPGGTSGSINTSYEIKNPLNPQTVQVNKPSPNAVWVEGRGWVEPQPIDKLPPVTITDIGVPEGHTPAPPGSVETPPSGTQGPPELFVPDEETGKFPTYTKDESGNWVLVQPMAHGGVTNANTLLVGERGPELVQRRGSLLQVIPLGRTAAAATGGEFNLSTQFQTPGQLSTAGNQWAQQYGTQQSGTYGAGNPYRFQFQQYSPETMGSQPFIQQLRGQMPVNEFQAFGAQLSNPSLGISNMPWGHQANYRTLLNMNPSALAQTRSLYEQGLHTSFDDFIAASQRAAPRGTRFGVASYGGR